MGEVGNQTKKKEKGGNIVKLNKLKVNLRVCSVNLCQHIINECEFRLKRAEMLSIHKFLVA